MPAHPSASTASSSRSLALMLGSVACFVANVLSIRALGQVQSVSIWLTAGTRFVVGLGLIAVFYRREVRPARLFRSRQLMERGLVGGASIYVYYLTIVHLGAGRATFINSTYVIWGGFLAVALIGERFRLSLVTGCVTALTGLALLTNVFATGAAINGYDFLALLTAFGSAYVVVTIRQLHATEHTSTIFAAQCGYGLLICAVPAALHPEHLTAAAWSLMLFAGVCAGAGQLLMTRAFRDLSVAQGSLCQTLVPVGIAVGGIVLYHEHFTLPECLGALLILAGTLLPALKRPAWIEKRSAPAYNRA